jgi:NADPH2:quinone reductase
VRVRGAAAPLNPSDPGLLFGGADLSTAEASGTADRPVVRARVPPAAIAALAGRFGQSLPAGNEGAGVVIGAGDASAVPALLGKTVAMLGGAMYAQCRCIKASDCLVLPLRHGDGIWQKH